MDLLWPYKQYRWNALKELRQVADGNPDVYVLSSATSRFVETPRTILYNNFGGHVDSVVTGMSRQVE